MGGARDRNGRAGGQAPAPREVSRDASELPLGPGGTPDDFALISQLARSVCGLALTDRHRSMVAARLPRLARESGFATVRELLSSLAAGGNRRLLMRFADSITTHHTYFARDLEIFQHYHDVLLPRVVERIPNSTSFAPDLRIWCAAASTGEEPWTLALIGREVLRDRYVSWRAGLLATDVSPGVLAQAARGEYATLDVERLPATWHTRWFEFVPGRTDMSRVRQELRTDVVFRRLNLLDPFPFKQPFHVVFCRNVLIYFDGPTRRAVIEKLINSVPVGGNVVVGSSESLDGTPRVRRIHPAIYERVA